MYQISVNTETDASLSEKTDIAGQCPYPCHMGGRGGGQTFAPATASRRVDGVGADGSQQGPRPVMMSFWPQVARALLRDGMPLEFRKRRNGCEEGTRVLVYASKEVGGVVGSYTVGKVIPYENLDELEMKLQTLGYDIQRPNLDKYLVGTESGFAHEVIDPQVIETPLKLGVDANGKKIKGPQGFQYVDPENADHARIVEILDRAANAQVPGTVAA